MGGAPLLYGGRTAKRIVADLGPAPGGVTNSRFMATGDLTEFIVKAGSYCSGIGPYIPANEMVDAELANLVDIPVLPWQFLYLPGGELAWGSLRIDNADFAPMSPGMVGLLADATLFSAVAVFDFWICNTDRHSGNLLCRKNRNVSGYALLPNDHSHALIREHFDPAMLAVTYSTVAPVRFFRSPELRQGVIDCGHLRDTIDRIETIPDNAISMVVAGVPDAWMDQAVQVLLTDFLIARARQIRSLLQPHMVLFPNAAGVVL